MMLSRTDPTKTWCSWVTRATSVRSTGSGRVVSSTPPTVTDPVRGPLIPDSSRPSVDLPDPLGPTMASRSPGRRARSTPCSTSTSGRYANRRSRPTSRLSAGRASPASRSGGTDAMPSSRLVEAIPTCSLSSIRISRCSGSTRAWT